MIEGLFLLFGAAGLGLGGLALYARKSRMNLEKQMAAKRAADFNNTVMSRRLAVAAKAPPKPAPKSWTKPKETKRDRDSGASDFLLGAAIGAAASSFGSGGPSSSDWGSSSDSWSGGGGDSGGGGSSSDF